MVSIYKNAVQGIAWLGKKYNSARALQNIINDATEPHSAFPMTDVLTLPLNQRARAASLFARKYFTDR